MAANKKSRSAPSAGSGTAGVMAGGPDISVAQKNLKHRLKQNRDSRDDLDAEGRKREDLDAEGNLPAED